MKLIYYGKLPGINDLTLSNRTNRYAGAFLKKTNMQRVANDFKIQARGVKFKKHVNIKINCYEANFRRDDDNVTGGASKIICDALQLANIIINDSPKFVHVVAERFQSADKTYRTEVIIEEGERP